MWPIYFYNSLTKRREEFKPYYRGKIRIYNCGPTVYKRQHLGNMRRFLFADFLRRSLEFMGYEVKEITNITDVGHLTLDELEAGEDKIEKAARQEKTTPADIAQKQIKFFQQDLQALNIQSAHLYPRASGHIPQMIKFIERLLEKGYAYRTEKAVYFDVNSFPSYGVLSGNTLEKLAAGKRIAVRGEKKHPLDFALWIVDPKHLQKWPSPWGVGYPGWHIECSAMSVEYLGTNIDIHTGGEDNRFPHHENEIAQTEAALAQPLARVWLHNAHLQMAGQKLAKRHGEQLTVDTLREKGFDPLIFRLFIFAAHYRSKLEFSWEGLAAAQENVKTIENLLRRLPTTTSKKAMAEKRVLKLFGEALADDLNTPQALAVFFEYIHQAHRQLDASRDEKTGQGVVATLYALDRVLGIITSLHGRLTTAPIPPSLLVILHQREAARHAKDFKHADELRRQLEQAGYEIEDTPQGPRLIKQQR